MAYAQFVGGSIGDKDLVMMIAQLMVSGKQLYTDIAECNLPLIFWLYMIPAYLSRLTGMVDYHVLVLCSLLLILLSAKMSLEIIALHPQFRDNAKQQGYFVLLLLNIFIVSSGIFPFADREHTFIVLIFPYLLRWMPSLARMQLSRRQDIIIGIMAGVGFCIKPHCLIVFAFIQLFYLLRERNIRILFSIPNLIIYTAGVLYISSIYVILPDYFHVILPMTIIVYPSYNTASAIIMYLIGPFVTLAFSLSEFRIRNKSPFRPDVYYGLLLCIPFMVYILSNNGWGYTVCPLSSVILLVVGLLWWEFHWLAENAKVKGESPKAFVFGIRACKLAMGANVAFSLFAASLLIPQVAMALYPNTQELVEAQTCSSLMTQELKNAEPRIFGVIAIDHSFWPKLSRDADATLGTRFFNLWPLRMFAKKDAVFEEKNKWIIDFVIHTMAADTTTNKPQIFFVELDKSRKSYLLDYMLRFPEFAQVWKNFAETDASKATVTSTNKGGCKFAVYKLNPA